VADVQCLGVTDTIIVRYYYYYYYYYYYFYYYQANSIETVMKCQAALTTKNMTVPHIPYGELLVQQSSRAIQDGKTFTYL